MAVKLFLIWNTSIPKTIVNFETILLSCLTFTPINPTFTIWSILFMRANSYLSWRFFIKGIFQLTFTFLSCYMLFLDLIELLILSLNSSTSNITDETCSHRKHPGCYMSIRTQHHHQSTKTGSPYLPSWSELRPLSGKAVLSGIFFILRQTGCSYQSLRIFIDFHIF